MSSLSHKAKDLFCSNLQIILEVIFKTAQLTSKSLSKDLQAYELSSMTFDYKCADQVLLTTNTLWVQSRFEYENR
ncbi:unnamed protein product [Moneuplotes crassus]|uniref:Uncharacterized protein n=1 Tax=Euplotes crassus TaxID=5936 RepID=A0AAD1XN13_EUPCR|nr:unnamed protein product [Moneuplotes crassus]